MWCKEEDLNVGRVGFDALFTTPSLGATLLVSRFATTAMRRV